MHIFQMHCLREFLRIIIVDLVVIEIEQGAFTIVFENRAKDPAVSVIIGELGVFELRIQFRDFVGAAQGPRQGTPGDRERVVVTG